MRKASRAMDTAFALEVLDKAPYITACFTRRPTWSVSLLCTSCENSHASQSLFACM